MKTNLNDFFQHSEYTMRKLAEPDISATVALLNAAFQYQELATGHKRTNPEHLRNYMKQLNCFVITNKEKIIGTAAFESRGNALHFGLVSVVDDYRGTGLAQRIMRAIEQYALDQNYELLELDYMSIAPWLKKYYEKYGFKTTGHTEIWKDTDLIQMQKKVDKD